MGVSGFGRRFAVSTFCETWVWIGLFVGDYRDLFTCVIPGIRVVGVSFVGY